MLVYKYDCEGAHWAHADDRPDDFLISSACMEAWECAGFLAVLAESLSVDQERGLMDHRRVCTSRLPPLSRREKPCLRAGGCWGGFAGGELFRVGRYVSTGAGEVVRDFERKMRHCVRGCSFSQPLVLSKTLFGNCGQVLSQEALSFRKLSGRHVLRSRARSGLRVLAGAACAIRHVNAKKRYTFRCVGN